MDGCGPGPVDVCGSDAIFPYSGQYIPVHGISARDAGLWSGGPKHAVRVAEHFNNAEVVWVDDSRTSSPSTSPRFSPPTSKSS